MIQLYDVEKFNDLIFKHFRITPRMFGFNVDNFIDILQNDCKIQKIHLYRTKFLDKCSLFFVHVDLINCNKNIIELSYNKILIKYLNKYRALHRFNDWAYKHITLYETKKIMCSSEEYRLFGNLHNLKGPAVKYCENIWYNKEKHIDFFYYINGKQYNLDNYCKILSKRMGFQP